jgi:hypothetical protein
MVAVGEAEASDAGEQLACTSVRLSFHLAVRLLGGFVGRRHPGSLCALPAIFLDAQQGTFEKINIQRLARDQAFQFGDAPPLLFLFFLPNLSRGLGAGNRDAAEDFISPSVHL